MLAARCPVVMVAGIDDTGAKMADIDRYLAARGWPDRLRVSLVPSNGSVGLDRLAVQLKEASERFAAEHHSRRFDLVAFSLGGIVSRYYLEELGGAAHVSHFVCLSSPHHGTYTAFLRGGPGVAQMRPGSPLLTELDRDEATLRTISCTSIWTPLDLMIVPARSSNVSWARDIQIPVLLHPWMVSDKRVLAAVAAALASPVPRAAAQKSSSSSSSK